MTCYRSRRLFHSECISEYRSPSSYLTGYRMFIFVRLCNFPFGLQRDNRKRSFLYSSVVLRYVYRCSSFDGTSSRDRRSLTCQALLIRFTAQRSILVLCLVSLTSQSPVHKFRKFDDSMKLVGESFLAELFELMGKQSFNGELRQPTGYVRE